MRAALPRRLAGWLDPAAVYLEAHRAHDRAPLVPVHDDPLGRFGDRRQRAVAVALRHRSVLEVAARQLVADGTALVETTDGELTVRLVRFRRGDHVLEASRPVRSQRGRPGAAPVLNRTRVPRRRDQLVATLVDRLAWEVTGIGRAVAPARPAKVGPAH